MIYTASHRECGQLCPYIHENFEKFGMISTSTGSWIRRRNHLEFIKIFMNTETELSTLSMGQSIVKVIAIKWSIFTPLVSSFSTHVTKAISAPLGANDETVGTRVVSRAEPLGERNFVARIFTSASRAERQHLTSRAATSNEPSRNHLLDYIFHSFFTNAKGEALWGSIFS